MQGFCGISVRGDGQEERERGVFTYRAARTTLILLSHTHTHIKHTVRCDLAAAQVTKFGDI